MPQLVKGGKWVFGWVVVGPAREILIPPEALREYGFQVRGEVLLLPGSRRSGGFGVSTPALIAAMPEQLRGRIFGRARIDENGRLTLPQDITVKPGDRLLAVRGSGRALGFVTQGPIYEEALKHPEVEVFDPPGP